MHQHIIASASGPPGCGKTTFLTAIGFMCYLMGYRIFANFHLKYPHIYVESKEQLYKMKNGLFLGDELWRWLFSRRSMRKDQQDIITDFVENIRKRGINMVYTGHTDRTIDVIVREITTTFIRTRVVPLIVPNKERIGELIEDEDTASDVYKILKKALSTPENYGVFTEVGEFNEWGEWIEKNKVRFDDLTFWGDMFSTTEEVGELRDKVGGNGERPGLSLEKWVYNQLPPEYFMLLPNSGAGSGLPGDIKSIEPAEPTLIDVKDFDGMDRIDFRTQKLINYLNCTRSRGINCYFAIKRDNKLYFVQIKEDSSFINNKRGVSFGQLKSVITKRKFLSIVIPKNLPVG